MERAHVLLSMQRALLDHVTADLRGVSITWAESSVKARFFYDAEVVAEDSRLLMLEAETYFCADFDDTVRTEFVAEAVPSPVQLPIERGEIWVHLMFDPHQESD